MSTLKRALARLGLELGYFTGIARILARRTGGLGVVLRFERVRPRVSGGFQPLRAHEVTPEFLDRTLLALKRWKFDVVSIDDVIERLRHPATHRRRFVCLTFDGGYRDFLDHAYPVLARHQVPFTLYVPASFPDGLGELWWLALEQVIAQHDRIGLVIDGVERRFDCSRRREKREVYGVLHNWLRSLPAAERSIAIRDLCARYGVDLKAVSRDAVMTWPELSALSSDPRVTIGSATLNYPLLSRTLNDAAERELKLGRAVVEAAIGRSAPHVAYPFGDSRAFGRRHVLIATQLDFASAVTAEPGVIVANGQTGVMSMPRMTWDGRRRSLRTMRVILSGITVAGRGQPAGNRD
ncbi:polysaccharide deacetylase family protein [Bradyrhizobium sp. LHD-71]|uniref:polysaccharide deacetylase family protein n=1 Tax=Bradyrhizobium sp. LHD-71 TaxID=3072141 RepID=UPI00280CC05D|nr:polysaccharide deacetylase family protein [Bradyrhizobium sp. LHD-71]MDQ8726112.1 polysaccharide deacetylase family protein [Bradyrhizobium sp. LHD-71]